MATQWIDDPRSGQQAFIRAARAYAGLTRKDLVSRIQDQSLTERLLGAYESGAEPASNARHLDAIARVCAVPRAFLTDGFQDNDATQAPQGLSSSDMTELLALGRAVNAVAALEKFLRQRHVSSQTDPDEDSDGLTAELGRVDPEPISLIIEQLNESDVREEVVSRIKRLFAERNRLVHGQATDTNERATLGDHNTWQTRVASLEALVDESEDLIRLLSTRTSHAGDAPGALSDLVAVAKAADLGAVLDPALRREVERIRAIDERALAQALSLIHARELGAGDPA